MTSKRMLKSILAGISLLTVMASSLAHASSEEQVKAALVYKLGQFVKWDYDPATINYCFIGSSAHGVGKVLADKKDKGKLPSKIKISTLESIDRVKQYQCQIIYTVDLNKVKRSVFLDLSQTTLTVTEGASSFDQGLIAAIDIKQRKAKLSVSQSNLKLSGIVLDSRLLSVVKLFP